MTKGKEMEEMGITPNVEHSEGSQVPLATMADLEAVFRFLLYDKIIASMVRDGFKTPWGEFSDNKSILEACAIALKSSHGKLNPDEFIEELIANKLLHTSFELDALYRTSSNRFADDKTRVRGLYVYDWAKLEGLGLIEEGPKESIGNSYGIPQDIYEHLRTNAALEEPYEGTSRIGRRYDGEYTRVVSQTAYSGISVDYILYRGGPKNHNILGRSYVTTTPDVWSTVFASMVQF